MYTHTHTHQHTHVYTNTQAHSRVQFKRKAQNDLMFIDLFTDY